MALSGRSRARQYHRRVPVGLKWFAAALSAVTLLAVPAAAQATLAFVRYPSNPTVFIARDDGSAQRRIARGSNPQVSPDGDEIAYLRPGRGRLGLPELMLATASGTIPPRLLASEMQASDAFAWSPDSTKIATVRVDEKGTEFLVLVDIVANTQRIVARGFFDGVGFDPESEQLIYARAYRERFPARSDIYRAEVVGGKPTRLTHDHRSLSPLWGPTGEIVFAKQLGAKQRRYGPKNELYLMDENGRQVRRLTHTEVDPLLLGLFPTAWSSSGRQLLAEFEGQDTSYAVAVDPRSGTQRTLTEDPEQGFVGTALSSRGRTVLGFTGGFEPGPGHDVVRIPYRGGKPKVLARSAFEPSWSR